VAELKNSKYEAFAQAKALGMNNVEAARASGFAGDRGNSSHIANRPEVLQRVAEIRLTMPQPDPVPASEPEPVANGSGTTVDHLVRLREEGIKRGQVNASVQAQKELSRIEREDRKADKHRFPDYMSVARKLIPVIDAAMRRGGTAAEVVCRMMGIVSPAEQAALGVPLAKRSPATNGHAKV